MALTSTVGRPKVEVMAERIRDINPDCQVEAIRAFFNPETCAELLPSDLDYVVDAIDTVSSKLLLIEKCKELGIPIISSMGAGNKLDPTKLTVVDISKTSVDPLAKVVRRELRKRGIYDGVQVVYSTEPPITPRPLSPPPAEQAENPTGFQLRRRQTPGSSAFVPPTAGLIIASVVARELGGL